MRIPRPKRAMAAAWTPAPLLDSPDTSIILSRATKPMAPRKPKHLAPEYAAQFQLPDVAQAYRARPAYPAALFELLKSLISGPAARVLELGAGTGDLTQGLAAHCDALDAVEPSAAMLSIARQRCTSPNVTWHELSAEDYVFTGPYALAVAAES